ncbi:hypothetical protein [Bradyrhizobium elkanii]|uniref:hypothetical protein n=1 Tax=Bradyrhizobium elkanii TaxID=29448 RepID=UPI00040F0AEB|nr:hypothetical protein [Bradyrhizobium elkanii]
MTRIIFSTKQAPGALPNGTQIVKVESEPRDANPIGTRGKVLGSISHPDVGLGYFVEWSHLPGVPVFVVDWKIGRAS